MIIFVRTKTATAELAEKLEARGYSASALNGDMNQALRERTINRLKKKQLDIIVATDVAARGIDVERVSHVLNFDIPYDPEAYVHRIGRTGRAGREGKAILFVAPREKRLLQAIEKATRKPISKMDLPSGLEVSSRRIEQFKQQLTETLENQSLDFFHQVLSEYSIEADRSAEDIACALAYLLQKDKPLEVKDEPPRRKQRDSFDKPERNDNRKSARKREEGKRNKTDINMVRYRIEVGRDDGVTPGNVVGAIANESGIDGDHIGHIKLYDDYSTVDLPEGMPKDMLNTLKKVRICNKVIFISEEGKAGQDDKPSAPKKKKGKSNASGKPKKDKAAKSKKTDAKSKVKKRKVKT